MRIDPSWAAAFLITISAAGQSMQTATVHGRHAWVLENGLIRVSTLRGGGSLAEVRFQAGDPRRTVNPMRVPHYQTIEPYQYDPAKHDALFGRDSHRWLHSGYMGHYVCFPAFGPPSSPQEVENGLGNHGEAPIVEWKAAGDPRISSGLLQFRYGADLPKNGYRIERNLTMPAGETVLYVEEWVENLELYDRPINWVQHATFGPPFTEPGNSFLDLSGTKVRVAGGAPSTSSITPEAEFEWPTGAAPGGEQVSLRSFQPKPNSGTYYAVLMDQKRPVSFFTMYNAAYPVLIGYLFRTSESPWIGDFQENLRLQAKPWDGKTVTRGIEFGTTPFAEGLRKSVERGELFGVPSYRWIAGKQRLKTTYAVFLTEIPEKFAGVADVEVGEAVITIHERESGRAITIPASQLHLLR